MECKVVDLEEKIIMGVCARTANSNPKMEEIIGSLWKQFYQDGLVTKIKNRANEYAYGLYSDYQEDGSYKVTVGCEVTVQEKGIEKDWTVTRIPAGKYARFTVYGDMVKAVAKAWAEIWEMNLNRTWTGDFEEYVDNNMTVNAKIYIYIAIA